MRDRELYAQILGIRAPGKVAAVDLDTAGATVEVHVRNEAGSVSCPECGTEGPRHDHRERRWCRGP
jgi:transposase